MAAACAFIFDRILIKWNNSQNEMLSVDIKKPNSKAFNVTVAYRHPSCTVGFFEALEAIVRIIDMESKEQIILGDLNCNY